MTNLTLTKVTDGQRRLADALAATVRTYTDEMSRMEVFATFGFLVGAFLQTHAGDDVHAMRALVMQNIDQGIADALKVSQAAKH